MTILETLRDCEGRKISNKIYSDESGPFIKRHGWKGILDVTTHMFDGKPSLIAYRVAYYEE